jgi:nicotinate-nucleotide adenylyltransferase
MAAGKSAPERLGILGGTFNPPHLGHLALARAAMDELGLERVLLIPAREAPHKSSEQDPGAGHRLRMCQLAAQADPRLEVSTLELDRGGPSYTVDTLHLIHATNPDVELTLIVGADMAQSLPGWREPRAILRLAGVAVAERPGVARDAVEGAVRAVSYDPELAFLKMAPLELSSSQVRARVAAGKPFEDLVGSEVAGYIAKQRLYREGSEGRPA